MPKAGISVSASNGGCGALLVSLERTLPSLYPATCHQLQQRGNPSISNPAGLLHMIVVDGDPLCVLAKCEELPRKEYEHHWLILNAVDDFMLIFLVSIMICWFVLLVSLLLFGFEQH
jgi:hypothetical protein